MSELVAKLNIERVDVAGLKPHPRNPRKHPEPGSPEWEVLKKSLGHDYFDPLVVNRRNGMLVSGHLRAKVLVDLGYTHVEVSIVDYDEETHLARLIAANRLIGVFDDEVLNFIAQDLEAAGLDIALAGFDAEELLGMLSAPDLEGDQEETEELVSAAEELQEKWQVEFGDLFQVGEHRLLCGDCTNEGSWRLLLGDKVADMVWTDPPYNVAYHELQASRVENNGGESEVVPQELMNDALSASDYEELLEAAFEVAFKFTKAGGAIYVAHAETHGLVNRECFARADWDLKQCLVWVKSGFTLGRQDHQWQHEPILYGWKPGAAHYWQGGFSESTVIDDEAALLKKSKVDLIEVIKNLRNDRDSSVIREPKAAKSPMHPTIKPLGLVARQIWNSSRKGEIVLELFGGSGTTLIAAEETGRRCVMTELDPKYCAVILERALGHGLVIEKVGGDV